MVKVPAGRKSVKERGTVKSSSNVKKTPLRKKTLSKVSKTKTKKSGAKRKRRALSAYEKKAKKEIHAWKNPQIGWFGRAMTVINKPLDKMGKMAVQLPYVGKGMQNFGEVVQKVIKGIMEVCCDMAHWSVGPTAIYKRFNDHGYPLRQAKDVFLLDLQTVDEIVGYLAAKYKGLALVEGGATGAAGIAGIVVDLPLLITLNLRAIGEYATYYGFDTRLQQERLFAMNILAYASSPNDASKAAALAQLVRIARDVARKQAWKSLEQHSFVQIMKQISKALGVRLTKAKLAQSIPIAGAVVGAGFNSYYTAKVCDAAYYLYRERFLAEKYGEKVIEQTVPPADDLEPEYQESEEEIFVNS